MLFVEFNAILQSYILIVLVLVFIDTCTKLYFSKKITFKHILECICFPIVMLLIVLVPITKTIGFIKEFILKLIYIRRAYVFILNTQGLSKDEIEEYIYENCLKENSLDIKFLD